MKKPFLFVLIIGLAILFYYLFDVHSFFSLSALKLQLDTFRVFVDEHYIYAVIIFISMYVLATAVSLPVGSALTLLGGALFGFLEGGLYVVVGATVGATIIFLLARYLLSEKFASLIGEKRRQRIGKEIEDNGFSYLLFLRLAPIFPFWVVNIVPGLVKVRLSVYVITTATGIVPGTFAYAYAGQEIGKIEELSDVLSRNFLLALVVLALFSLIPVVVKKYNAKKRGMKL